MQFRIADTFTDSLARLTGDEQKAVKTTAFDLQMNPASPGLQFHKLERARDKGFASVRVSADIRLIVHRSDDGLLLCYVDHHDKAYAWAERRRIERHPRTGAAQLVEVRETVREVQVPRYVDAPAATTAGAPKPMLFAFVSDEELLGYGVPADWLGDVRAATEDTVLDLADHLPPEASEALLALATGGRPKAAAPIPASESAFSHPDAQRRFRVMTNVEELERALAFPWEKWAVFLHPSQRELVERRFNGPVRIAGSAGTGKTVVAIHRAVQLARVNPSARVLLTTFSPTLARVLRQKVERLVGNDQALRDRVDVLPIAEVGRRVYAQHFGEPRVLDEATVRRLVRDAAAASDHRQSESFLLAEWNDVVDAWDLQTWQQYRDVQRLGRKSRLSEAQRRSLWGLFERMWEEIRRDGRVTGAGVFHLAAKGVMSGTSPYAFAVVDESQDLTVGQLRLLGALAGSRPDGLFCAGDLGQQIFQTPFSWRSLGVDIRGRSHTLRINYRTSHQIRLRADGLLPTTLTDVDGVAEQRKGTVSVFNGPEPLIVVASSVADEVSRVSEWIKSRLASGLRPEEIGVFVRSADQLSRAERAVRTAGCASVQLDSGADSSEGKMPIATMHLAKGLEFRAVAVIAVDHDVVPLQDRIEAIADEAELESVYSTERHLLYVACTRARDHLLVTGVKPASEFLGDLERIQKRVREASV